MALNPTDSMLPLPPESEPPGLPGETDPSWVAVVAEVALKEVKSDTGTNGSETTIRLKMLL